MSETQTSPAEPIAATEAPARAARFRSRKRHTFAALAAVAIIGAGAAGGAAAMNAARASGEVATPVAISDLSSTAMVSVKGNVAEIFGNKFILQDGSGRALVETGPAGDNGKLVAPNEAVTVQGRFDHGFIHADFLVHGDGTVVAVGPPPPPHGPRGPHDHAGGPDRPAPHEGPGPNDTPPPPAPPVPDAAGAPGAQPAPDAPAAPAAPAGDAPAAPASPAPAATP